jgi:hypothetical protein
MSIKHITSTSGINNYIFRFNNYLILLPFKAKKVM